MSSFLAAALQPHGTITLLVFGLSVVVFFTVRLMAVPFLVSLIVVVCVTVTVIFGKVCISGQGAEVGGRVEVQ